MKPNSTLSNSRLTEKLVQAKAIYAEILNDERSLLRTQFEMMVRAWKLGGILCALKEEIGHGKWLFWLGGNFPELSERTAQRCMQFFKANETWKLSKSAEFGGFDPESVRKILWAYIPEKERPQLQGDGRDAPAAHYLTFVNNFAKWDRQIQIGQATMPDVEVLRHDLEQTLRRIAELCGRDWVASILG